MRILVALDLGDTTAGTVDALRRIFGPEHELWLLHVAEPDPSFVGWGVGPESIRQFVARRFRSEHKALQKIADDFRSDGYRCTAVLVQGSFADSILEQATAVDADLIAMGTHGKGLAKQLVVGSTSESVLRQASCPVLLVPT